MSLELQHFLQSSAWEDFQQSLGRKTIRRRGDGWEYLAIVEQGRSLTRLYCPYGPIATSEAALSEALVSLETEARIHKAQVLRVQPVGVPLSRASAHQLALQPIQYSQPSVTWRLDLSPSLEELYAAMKQNTRNICRNYQKKDMTYRSSNNPADITTLLKLLAGVAAHNKITVHSDHYFTAQADSLLPTGNALLHFIDYQGEPIAAALTYRANGVTYYAHAAADFEHRKLGASTALLGELIKHAKADGDHTFDFYGIAPTDDPHHPQAGFTRFKQSFGGYRHEYNQTYERPLSPLRYRLYQLSRKLYRFLL